MYQLRAERGPHDFGLGLALDAHSSPSRLVLEIPDFPRHLWHTNSNQPQHNSCQAWLLALPPTTVHDKSKLVFFYVPSTEQIDRKQDITLSW